MFRVWLGSFGQVRLSSSSLGDVLLVRRRGYSGCRVVEDRKKTGSRRRNVIKEDLVAEEDEALEAVSSTCGPVSRANGDRRGLASGSNGC